MSARSFPISAAGAASVYGTDAESLPATEIVALLVKKCKVAQHQLVMSLKVDLYPAHSPNRAQNRRGDIGPNRIIEIYD